MVIAVIASPGMAPRRKLPIDQSIGAISHMLKELLELHRPPTQILVIEAGDAIVPHSAHEWLVSRDPDFALDLERKRLEKARDGRAISTQF